MHSNDDIPPEVQEFIFEYIDSVDQLDVLLLLRSQQDRRWTAEEVSNELRSNSNTAAARLLSLKSLGALKDDGDSPPAYQYRPATPKLEKLIDGLAETYKVRRHKVYGLIFSSVKAARKFLNAFTVVKESEDDND